MEGFYSNLMKSDMTPSQALRDAQLKMQQSPIYSSPFYWAAFNLQGDFRRTPKLSPRTPNLAILFIIVSVAALAIAYGLYRYVWHR